MIGLQTCLKDYFVTVTKIGHTWVIQSCALLFVCFKVSYRTGHTADILTLFFQVLPLMSGGDSDDWIADLLEGLFCNSNKNRSYMGHSVMCTTFRLL